MHRSRSSLHLGRAGSWFRWADHFLAGRGQPWGSLRWRQAASECGMRVECSSRALQEGLPEGSSALFVGTGYLVGHSPPFAHPGNPPHSKTSRRLGNEPQPVRPDRDIGTPDRYSDRVTRHALTRSGNLSDRIRRGRPFRYTPPSNSQIVSDAWRPRRCRG